MNSQTSEKGLYFQANDRVEEWLLPYLRSLRSYAPDMRLVMIPWDDRIERVSRLASEFSFEILDVWNDYREQIEFLDSEAARCFKNDLGRCPYLRCLLVFCGPLETFIFSDVDIIAMSDFGTLLDTYDQSDADVMFLQRSPGFVYQNGPFRSYMRNTMHSEEFNTGFWASRRGRFSLQDISDCINHICSNRRDFCLNGDQPVLNYLFDMKGGARSHFRDVLPDLSESCWPHPDREGLVETRQEGFFWDKSVDDPNNAGKRLALLHWAGIAISINMPHWPYYAAWRCSGMTRPEKLGYFSRLWGQHLSSLPVASTRRLVRRVGSTIVRHSRRRSA